MIQFEDLDLIAVIKGRLYRIVSQKGSFGPDFCANCDLYETKECKEYTCYSPKLDMHFHYEKILKYTHPAMR